MKAACFVPTGLLHLYRFKSLIAFHQQKPPYWVVFVAKEQYNGA